MACGRHQWLCLWICFVASALALDRNRLVRKEQKDSPSLVVESSVSSASSDEGSHSKSDADVLKATDSSREVEAKLPYAAVVLVDAEGQAAPLEVEKAHVAVSGAVSAAPQLAEASVESTPSSVKPTAVTALVVDASGVAQALHDTQSPPASLPGERVSLLEVASEVQDAGSNAGSSQQLANAILAGVSSRQDLTLHAKRETRSDLLAVSGSGDVTDAAGQAPIAQGDLSNEGQAAPPDAAGQVVGAAPPLGGPAAAGVPSAPSPPPPSSSAGTSVGVELILFLLLVVSALLGAVLLALRRGQKRRDSQLGTGNEPAARRYRRSRSGSMVSGGESPRFPSRPGSPRGSSRSRLNSSAEGDASRSGTDGGGQRSGG